MEIEISIIIPVYNVEDYLEECLESAYKVNLKKEIIIVDDGSPDQSYLIINKYKEKYPKITKLIRQQNGGLSFARNSGFNLAKGKYVYFLDSDDFIDPTKFENLYKAGEKNNLDIICGGRVHYKEGQIINKPFKTKKIKNLEIISGIKYLEENLKEECYSVAIWTSIYKNEFLLKNKLSFLEGIVHEDVLFTPQVLYKANKVKFYDYDFYFYREREGSITKKKRSIENKKSYILVINELLKFVYENKVENYFFKSMILNYYFHIKKEYKIKDKELDKKIYKIVNKRDVFMQLKYLIYLAVTM